MPSPTADNPTMRERSRKREEAQANFIQMRKAGLSIPEALRHPTVNRSNTTYEKWRKTDRAFRGATDVILLERRMVKGNATDFADDFAGFRKLWFKHDSPWFHLAAIEALEKAEPGSVTLVLFPPEHGKTTLMEDYMCWKLATEPSHRFMVGSEKFDHGRKVVGRVKNRMEPGGPFPSYVAKFGPFAPQLGDDGYQPWGAGFMNVRNKGNHDERDYSLAALGFGATIIGTRTDTLFVDDPQSTKTLSLTENMVETFRQDWLSRPGPFGKTVVWGSRVGEEDFYMALLDADVVDTRIEFPAVRDNTWLWPERYTPANYERMRKNVGEAAWQRNYMMRPQAAGESKFTQEMLDTHADPLRATWTVPPEDTRELAVGVDPGFGINATMVAAFCPGRMVILSGRVDHQLRNNQEIVGIVGEMIETHRAPGKIVSQVIMEDKAFQKGLLNDESLIRLRDRYGFSITGHNCVDPQTEVLSRRGWLKNHELLVGDEILTLNLDSQASEWKPVRLVYRGHHDGPMFRFSTQSVDALCTPDHKWPVKVVNGRDRMFLVEAQNLNTGHIIPKARPRLDDVPETWDDDLVELAAWCVTEGHFRPGTQIRLGQSARANHANVERIVTLLKRMEADFRVNERRDTGVIVWSINGEVARRVRQAVGDQVGSKSVPPEFVAALTRHQLGLFLEVMVLADGWQQGMSRYFCSDDDSLIQAVEMAAALHGTCTHRKERADDPGHWVVTIWNSCDFSQTNPRSRPTVEDYSGEVWCPQTENGTFYARRGGYTYFTGNTGSTKNDEDFGVASMAAGFLRGEIVLPGSDDPQTRAFREALDSELKAWRPRKRGTQLRQDMVMSLWFLWLLWRRRREFITVGPSNWDTGVVPFNTQAPRLIVPVGAGGWRS